MSYNLGTAYIRIAPSMQGVQKTITSELNKAGSSGGEAFEKSLTKKITVGTFLGNMATKAFDAVSNGIRSSLDAAINRSDELSYRFGKSMENVGIDTEKAKDAISRVSDALIGLPTTTDEAARSIKKLAAASGDVDKASDMFLGFNNALLAGAAPAERQTEALRQMSEAYSRGKPDMKEWRIWMETMPGQLSQVAKAMGYGSNGAQKLGEDLRRGNISMDDFMNTFVKLNNSDADGFTNFATQAQNAVGGLNVSMVRMRTAVTRGVTTMIDALQGGENDIGKAYASMGSLFEGLLSGNAAKIKDGSDGIIKALKTLGPRVSQIIKNLAPQLAQFLATEAPRILNELILQATNIVTTLVTYLPDIVSALMQALPTIIDGLVATLFNPDTLQKLINAAIDTVFAIVDHLPDIIVALVDALPTIITTIVEVLTSPDTITRLIAIGPKLIVALVKGIIGGIGSLIAGCQKVIMEVLKKFGELPGKIVEVGTRLVQGLWNGINDAVGWVMDKIKGFGQSILDGIKSFFGIKSPSKVMAEQGKYLAQGLGIGIEKNADYATRAMEDMANDVLAESALLSTPFSSPVAANIGGSGSGAVAKAVTQFNTFNQVANDLDMVEISRSLGFAVETAI